MRTHIAVSALAVGLALTGCGEQSLVGQGAMDPEHPQLSAEEAQQEAARLQEEGGVGHGAESGGSAAEGSGTGESAHGSGSGESESGGSESGGTGTTEAEANAGFDEGSGTVTSSESGTGTGSGAAQISDQAIAQFEQQFPAVSRVVSEQQLRTTATQVCSAISAGGTAAGQQVVETLPGVNGTTAQQIVGFFDREVCPR